MAGVDHLLQTMEDVGEIVVTGVTLVKRGTLGIGGIKMLFELVSDVRALIDDATAAMPELTDVDATEAGELAKQAYVEIKKIVEAVVG